MPVSNQLKRIRVDKIIADYSRNVRMDSLYATDPLPNYDPAKNSPGLYEQILESGLKVPLTVRRLTDAESEMYMQRDGLSVKPDWIVVQGHRRFLCISKIRKNVGSHFFEELACFCYTGLTKDEEYVLMMDHAGIKSLNRFEKYLQVKTLVLNTTLSEEAVARAIGESRGYVQRFKWISKLPEVVEENFRKKYEPDPEVQKTAIVFTDKDLNKLNMAANADRGRAYDPARNDSEFSAAWNALAGGEKTASALKSIARKDLLEKAEMVKDPILKNVILFCAGNPEVSLSDLVDQQSSLRKLAEEKSLLKSNAS